MIYTHFVNSKGTVGKDYDHPVNMPDTKTRLEQLQGVMAELSKKIEGLNERNVCLEIQEKSCLEKLLLFFKEPLDASDEIVRKANDKATRNESIMSSQENGRTQWWYLKVLVCEFERNLNDGKYIRCDCKVMNIVSGLAENAEEYYEKEYTIFFADDTGLSEDELLPYAVQEDGFVVSMAQSILQSYVAGNVYKDSNRAMRMLNSILNEKYSNKSEGFYEGIYVKFKRFIRSFENGWRVFYWANVIGFVFDGKDYEVYVTKKDEQVRFIICGNIYYSLDELEQAVRDGTAFEDKEWFDRIKPFLPQRPVKERPNTTPDVIL